MRRLAFLGILSLLLLAGLVLLIQRVSAQDPPAPAPQNATLGGATRRVNPARPGPAQA